MPWLRPAAIVYDFTFDKPENPQEQRDQVAGEPPPFSAGDEALLTALGETPHVALATLELPDTPFGGNLIETSVKVGQAGLPVQNGSVRELETRVSGTFETEVDGKVETRIFSQPSLAVAALQAAGSRVPIPPTALIDYSGPAGTVKMLSFADVVAKKVDRAAIEGKFVVVGLTETADDMFQTSAPGPRMPGVEVQANATSTLLRHTPLRPPARWLDALWVFLVALLAVAAGALGGRWSPFALVGVAALAVTAAIGAFSDGVVLSAVPAAVGLVSGGGASLLVSGTVARRASRHATQVVERIAPGGNRPHHAAGPLTTHAAGRHRLATAPPRSPLHPGHRSRAHALTRSRTEPS